MTRDPDPRIEPDGYTVRPLAYTDAVVRALEAELQQEYVASGGFRRHSEQIAEIKRMYVVEDRRGVGYARRLLAELEARAAAVGYQQIILETGRRQPEAIALYESSGYQPIPGFGFYADQALSRSFAKDLTLTS